MCRWQNALVPQSNEREKVKQERAHFWISQDIVERILPRIVRQVRFPMRCAMRIAHRGISQSLCV